MSPLEQCLYDAKHGIYGDCFLRPGNLPDQQMLIVRQTGRQVAFLKWYDFGLRYGRHGCDLVGLI